MKRIATAAVALLVFAGMSQAALFTVPSSWTRVLNPALKLVGKGSVSSFLKSLGIGEKWVAVRQSGEKAGTAGTTAPVEEIKQLAPQVSPRPSCLPADAALSAPRVKYAGKVQAVNPTATTRDDQGLHKGWVIGQHKGWYKQQVRQAQPSEPTITDDGAMRPGVVRASSPTLVSAAPALDQATTR
jgi:hypothetical protein